jgi:hypothetical protein
MRSISASPVCISSSIIVASQGFPVQKDGVILQNIRLAFHLPRLAARNSVTVERGLPTAPEGRQIHSLGRQPQGTRYSLIISPGGAADFGCSVSCSLSQPIVCRRFAACRFFFDLNLGLTPQAMYMSPLRGSPLARQIGLTMFVALLAPERIHRHHQTIQTMVTAFCQDLTALVTTSWLLVTS